MRFRAALSRAFSALRYLVGSLATSVPALLVVALLPLAMLLAFGIPGLPWIAGRIRKLTNVERRRAAGILGDPIPEPSTPRAADPYKQTVALLRSPAMWREVLWLAVHGFLGLVIAVFAVVLWLNLPWMASVPFWWWTLPPGTISAIWPLYNWTQAIVQPLVAIPVLALLMIWVTPYAAAFQGWYSKLLLGPTGKTTLAERVESLTD
jgi:hypothetical protein